MSLSGAFSKHDGMYRSADRRPHFRPLSSNSFINPLFAMLTRAQRFFGCDTVTVAFPGTVSAIMPFSLARTATDFWVIVNRPALVFAFVRTKEPSPIAQAKSSGFIGHFFCCRDDSFLGTATYSPLDIKFVHPPGVRNLCDIVVSTQLPSSRHTVFISL